LAPSVFHLFGPLRNHLGSKHFVDDKEVKTEVWKWLRQESKEFYAVGFNVPVTQWDQCINVGVGYVEK
jgi:hypothetical protein